LLEALTVAAVLPQLRSVSTAAFGCTVLPACGAALALSAACIFVAALSLRSDAGEAACGTEETRSVVMQPKELNLL
jgi:hypothetical protein